MYCPAVLHLTSLHPNSTSFDWCVPFKIYGRVFPVFDFLYSRFYC
jgi:hypothetical protein